MVGLALILPAADQADGNALACALGHDVLPGATFGVPLSADGSAPATHYGAHTWGLPVFVDLLTGAAQGTLPDLDWAAVGLTEARIHELVAALLYSTRPTTDDAAGHFIELAASAGLQPIAHDPFA